MLKKEGQRKFNKKNVKRPYTHIIRIIVHFSFLVQHFTLPPNITLIIFFASVHTILITIFYMSLQNNIYPTHIILQSHFSCWGFLLSQYHKLLPVTVLSVSLHIILITVLYVYSKHHLLHSHHPVISFFMYSFSSVPPVSQTALFLLSLLQFTCFFF